MSEVFEISNSNQAGERHTRLADRMVIHGRPLGFRELCEQAVPEETRILLFDLDRTIHFGRNMGELLGWELIALQAYGPTYLERREEEIPPSRFYFDWSRPLSVLKYLLLGGQNWAIPGLYYLLWGKLAVRNDWSWRRSFRRFGPDPVRIVQQVPQVALMSQMAEVPLETLRLLAGRVWRRYSADQVIDRRDIEWLRGRCPELTIIISSASPQPVLEAAIEELGVDEIFYSTVEEREGFLSAPFRRHRRLFGSQQPRRISPPSCQNVNSGTTKIARLLERHPEIADPDVCTVGITDTGYGEDHCWSRYLTRVVDINSRSPFSPIVSADSPLEEVHSASVLTQGERDRRAAGEPDFLDRRRGSETLRGEQLVFEGEELMSLLGSRLDSAEALSIARERLEATLMEARRSITCKLGTMRGHLEEAITSFNSSTGLARHQSMLELKRCLRADASEHRRLTRLERPLSVLAFELTRLLASSRASLDPDVA